MAQLKTGIWIDALIRRAQVAGAFAYVIERGDRDAGSVLVVVRGAQDQIVLIPERNMEGDRVWRRKVVEDNALRDLIQSRQDFDPDLNVVEIEDRDGRHFLNEPVVEDPKLDQAASAEDAADAVAAARALFRDR